jgi:hypothetical protein
MSNENSTSEASPTSINQVQLIRNEPINTTTNENIPPPPSLYRTAFKELKDNIDNLNISINSATIPLLIKYTMELVEKTPIKGPAQKDFACRLLRDIFKEATDGEEEKTLLLLCDNGTIGNTIDLIVAATQGKLDINAIKKVSKGCISACLPYLKGKGKNNKKN